MAKVLIKKLDPTVVLPAYKTDGASGMDLMALLKEPINLYEFLLKHAQKIKMLILT